MFVGMSFQFLEVTIYRRSFLGQQETVLGPPVDLFCTPCGLFPECVPFFIFILFIDRVYHYDYRGRIYLFKFLKYDVLYVL